MDTTAVMRKQMVIQFQVDRYNNKLIEQMRKLLDETKIAGSKMEKSQIGNLLEVTTETQSVELVKNFIQYQMGRDVGGTSWRSQSFGDRFVKLIDNELRRMAETVANQVIQDSGLEHSADIERQVQDEVWIELLRQFVGQMNRYFYYQKEAQRWSKRES